MTPRPKKRKTAKSKAIKSQSLRTEEPHPPELFHYTRIDGLKGILASNELWATSAFHLNDSSEFQTLWPLLQGPTSRSIERAISRRTDFAAQISENGGSGAVARTDAERWIETARGIVVGDRERVGRIGSPFVVSFTSHEDDQYHAQHGLLSQWRGYAGGYGVAIVFATQGLDALLRREEAAYDYDGRLYLADAIYHDDHEEVNAVIAEFASFAPVALRYQESDRPRLKEGLISNLIVTAARRKHRGFAEEKERRIIAMPVPKHLRKELPDPKNRPMKQVFYRRSDTSSIPYIRLFEEFGEPLPITRVIVGPSRVQKAVLEEVRSLLDGRDIVVHASEIPYVGSIQQTG